jgi:DNA primase
MDVVALAQAGFHNAIATCGTSITPEHVEVLRRFCDRVIVVMDADSAGQKAAANCFDLFLNSGIEVFGLALPEGEDPGSFLIGKRLLTFPDPATAETAVATEFEGLLKTKTEPILKSYLGNLLETAKIEQGGTSPAALGKISEQFVRLLGKIKNPVEREGTLQLGADILGVSRESLTSLQRTTPKQVVRQANNAPRQAEQPVQPVRPVAKKPAHVSTLKLRLTQFNEQMLIAVICEPSLSKSLLEMEDALKQLATENFPIFKLKELLNAIFQEEFVSLSNFKGRETSRDFRTYLVRFEKLLDSYTLNGKDLLSKAWNQIAIGGSQPEMIIHQALQFSKEFTLNSKVEVIKTKERETQDSSELGDLVQKKLIERRKLRTMGQIN